MGIGSPRPTSPTLCGSAGGLACFRAAPPTDNISVLAIRRWVHLQDDSRHLWTMATNNPADKASAAASTLQSGLVCARCEHVNPGWNSTCEGCGAGLWKYCPKCDQRNQRTASHCSACGTSLRPSTLARWRESRRVRPIHLLLLMFGTVIAYLIIKLVNLR